MRIPYISLLAAGALALGGCAYGDLGMGLGYGSPYYGSGYGSPYYGYGYSSPYYGSYGYGGYGSYYGGYGGYMPYGWYDDYYYPGSGYYVYDSYRQPHIWTNTQQRYWTQRERVARNSGTRTRVTTPNWSAFDRRATAKAERQTAREDRRKLRSQ